MTRLSSYRDFDWVLLGFVLLLSLISVLEIKSATLHTKFRGFDHKQIEFLAIGLALMFLISLIDYHRLLDTIHWPTASVSSPGCRRALRHEGAWRKAVDQLPWNAFSAVGMDQANPYHCSGPLLLGPRRKGTELG